MTTPDSQSNAAPAPASGRGWLAAALVLLALALFRCALAPGNILMSTDDNIGAIAHARHAMPGSFLGWWSDAGLAGIPGFLPVSWQYVLMWLLPVRFFTNWIHAIDLGLASFFLALFLRERGCRWPSCAVGLLAAHWVGSNFTLVYAGHTAKFGVVMFAALYLFLVERAVLRRSLRWAVLAGGALGAMFLEQQDVALFFAMPLGLYAVYATWRERMGAVPALLRILAPVVGVGLLVASRNLAGGREIVGSTVGGGEDPVARWEYATQWSWPPEESIDFVAPGYFGLRSGELA